MRGLAVLQRADSDPPTSPGPRWSPLAGGAFVAGAFLVVLSVALVLGVWWAYSTHVVTDTRMSQEQIDQEMEQLTPSGSWPLWISLSERPLMRPPTRHGPLGLYRLSRVRTTLVVLGVVALVGLVLMISSAFAKRPARSIN